VRPASVSTCKRVAPSHTCSLIFRLPPLGGLRLRHITKSLRRLHLAQAGGRHKMSHH
jgi:hypothetical protein